MFKVISFDIGGTLLNTESNNKYSLSELINFLGLPKDEVRKAYKEIFQKKKGTLLELVSLFCDMLNIDANDDIVDFFEKKYSKENNIAVLDSSIRGLFSKIKDMGYKIILLSNSCCLIQNDIDNDIMDNVYKVFYSYDYGYTKDDNEIYRIVEKELSCTKKEILHIGDNLGSDYIKPTLNGWSALFYGDCEDNNVMKISSLEEIIKIIEK